MADQMIAEKFDVFAEAELALTKVPADGEGFTVVADDIPLDKCFAFSSMLRLRYNATVAAMPQRGQIAG
jgi:hypothetical protein